MKSILILTFLLISQLVVAQDIDKTKLDAYFEALETNNRFMGSVAVAKDGEIIYTKSIGFADIDIDIKADENSKYRIGSISKTFTAAMIFLAIEKGKLDLNQTIDTYFPNIKNANKITISHLLNHRSGIHSFTNDDDYLTWNTVAKTKDQMLTIIQNAGSDFKPDSNAEYSNSNYLLLTYILEETFEKPYKDLLNEYIVSPIGLANTRLGEKINPMNNECLSYRYMYDWVIEPETDISIPMGAGGIISTPSDLIKFSEALFNGKLLKKESLELMKKMKDGYGMGLFPMPFNDKKGYGHTGGIDGFASIFCHFSEDNISYALISNGNNFNMNDISLAVLSAVYGMPFKIPEFKTYDVSAEDLNPYLGIYSSDALPLKITISKDKNTLIAQATGQSSFPLVATEKNVFEFNQAGVVLEFNPDEQTMLLKQGGGEFKFTKD